MLKTRLLLTLTLAAAALAATATTASATFVILNLNTKGPIKTHAQSTNDTVAMGAGEFGCEEAHYYGIESTETMETNLITVLPEYKKCTAKDKSFGLEEKGANVNVKFEGCTVTLHQKERGNFAGSVSILCPEGRTIHLNTGLLSCVIKVGSAGNNHLEKIKYSNKEGVEPLDIEIGVTVEGFSYTSEGCSLGGIKEGKNGTYKIPGTILVRALDQNNNIIGIHVI